jgi:hypothetical protein
VEARLKIIKNIYIIKSQFIYNMTSKISKKPILFLFSFLILILFSTTVLAEDSNSSTSSPFGGISIIITIIMIYQISKSEKVAIKEADNKRVGVAGWLLFFTGIIAIGGIVVVLRIISDIIQLIIYDPSLFISFTFIFTEFLDLISGIALIFAAYYLWKIKPRAKWLAIGVLVFDILVVGVNWLVSVDELYLALSFLTLFSNTIMIIYFLVSRRVKNTYVKNAKIPKTPASSNKTVKGWLIYQAIIGILIFVVFQFIGWSETAEYSADMPCLDFCSQYPETESYYYGYDEEGAGMLCQCHTADNVIADKVFPS